MECGCSPAKRRKILHTSQVNLPAQVLGSSGIRGDNVHSHYRKKLLVLDVNGLLVDIVADPDEAHKPDTRIGSKAVFKRPFCDEFLKFCFERFNVGVWTSRTRWNINQVLDFIMKDTRSQLVFCWDQSHCTETGFNTIENSDKPLLLKELKKLWEKQDPNLPWDRGVYDESNTIFLDDSPYKALFNPPNTAIFPYTYSYRNAQDNGLGPNGDLRKYLERLAASDNVQKFIEQNPFGQQPITYDSDSWNFYHKVMCSTQPGAGPSRSRKKLIVIDIAGLLVHIATFPREGFGAYTKLGSTAVFKRPYCDEFLQFCFNRFNVGVWTSTTRSNTEWDLDFLMRHTQHRLLFCWDLSHCTDTGFNSVENSRKRLLLKELSKLWTKEDPDIPWELGEYDESNTLLVNSTPHEALLNPPHTAIFPYPYHYWDTEDNSLGPKGDLRIYLERLATSENVQKFVSENSFGQRPIREKNLSWPFYQTVIRAMTSRRKAGNNNSVYAQCKNSSEPKPDTAVASVTQTLSVPKTDTSTSLDAPTLLEPVSDATTVSAVPTLSEPKPDSATTSTAHTLVEPETDTTTAMVGQTVLEPVSDTTTVSAAQTLLEPKPDSTTTSTDHTLVEPETNTTTAMVGQTLLEPVSDMAIVSAVQTSLDSETDTTTVSAAPTIEPETDPTTVSAAPTFLEPKPDTTTVLAAPTFLEPKPDTTTVLAAPTFLEPKPDTTTVSAPPTFLEPETDTTTVSAAPTFLEPETDTNTVSAAPTFLEPKTDTTTVSAAPTLHPKTDTAIVLAAPTFLEPKTDTATDLAAPTFLESKTDTTTVSAAPTLDPKTDTAIVLPAPTLEPKTDTTTVSVASTLDPKTNTAIVLAAPTFLEPKPNSTTTSVDHTLTEPEANSTTVSSAVTLLEPETKTTAAASGSQI